MLIAINVPRRDTQRERAINVITLLVIAINVPRRERERYKRYYSGFYSYKRYFAKNSIK